jgi:DNA-binding beta-propeller fold protein YncE
MKKLSLVLLAAGMTACGGGFTTTSVQPVGSTLRVAGSVERDTRPTVVYVSDHTGSFIDVFDILGKLQYTITTGLNAPVGIFVDARHNLWVANPGANDVIVFPRGSKTPSETLKDSNQPDDVAVCSDGTAFVADSLNRGGVAVYPPGHTSPVRRLEARQSGAGGREFYVTCDAAGNIFATGMIGLSPFVATTGWRHGRQSGYYLLPQAAWSPYGIKATAAKTLLIVTYASSSQPAVVEFTEAGKPTGREVDTYDLWGDIAFDSSQSIVYGVDTPMHIAEGLNFPCCALRRVYHDYLVKPEGVAIDPDN